MKGLPRALAVTLVVLVLGALLLKGTADVGDGNPIASVDNGAPRGLLALRLLYEKHGIAVQVLREPTTSLATALEGVDVSAGALVIEPPPEASSFLDDEAAQLLDDAEAHSADLLVLCDDEAPRTDRLKVLLGTLHVECVRPDDDVTIDDMTTNAAKVALGVLPAWRAALSVHGAGRVKVTVPALPAWTVGDDVIVADVLGKNTRRWVVGSATVLSNDGVVEGDNAAFALSLVPAGGTVVVDERHHRSRAGNTLALALTHGAGPLTGLLALLLLVPLSLLSLAPRPGDGPGDDDDAPLVLAADRQARALAAFLSRLPPAPGTKRHD
jgi:hypothetical protein